MKVNVSMSACVEVTKEMIDMMAQAMINKGDYVEVIRCKDCVFWGSTLNEQDMKSAREHGADLVCDLWESDGFDSDDYCSQGKRKKAGG